MFHGAHVKLCVNVCFWYEVATVEKKQNQTTECAVCQMPDGITATEFNWVYAFAGVSHSVFYIDYIHC